VHGLKLDRRRFRTRRCGVGHIDARHPGAVEHQPLCTLWAGRAPEGVALNSAHRRGVGFDLHQAHRRAARSALHHAPRYQARTWNALADHAVKRPLRIAQRRGRGATNCDEIGAVRGRLWAYPLAACGHSGDCNFRWARCRRRETLRWPCPVGRRAKLYPQIGKRCHCGFAPSSEPDVAVRAPDRMRVPPRLNQGAHIGLISKGVD